MLYLIFQKPKVYTEGDLNFLYMQMCSPNSGIVIESFLVEWRKLVETEEKIAYMMLWGPMSVFVKFNCKFSSQPAKIAEKAVWRSVFFDYNIAY